MSDEFVVDVEPQGLGRLGGPYGGTGNTSDLSTTDSAKVQAEEARERVLHARATRVARSLVALSISEAGAVMALCPELSVRFVEKSEGATEEYAVGRITALTRHGVVTTAGAG